MYGLSVNLGLSVTEDIIEMQSNPVDTDTGGIESVRLTGVEFRENVRAGNKADSPYEAGVDCIRRA